MDGHERGTRIEDERHGLERVLNYALREAEACAGYALDAEAIGDDRLASFFREVRTTHKRIAKRTEGMLGGGVTGCPWSVFRLAEPRPKGIRVMFRQARMMRKRDNLCSPGLKRAIWSTPSGYLRASLMISKISPMSASRF